MAAGREIPAPAPDAPGPFSLASPDRVRSILGTAGFSAIEVEGVSAGMWFGHDPDDAHRLVRGMLGWMLEGSAEDLRDRALEALRATVTAHQGPEGVTYGSAAWIVRARSHQA
jgi:hypothetical protein